MKLSKVSYVMIKNLPSVEEEGRFRHPPVNPELCYQNMYFLSPYRYCGLVLGQYTRKISSLQQIPPLSSSISKSWSSQWSVKKVTDHRTWCNQGLRTRPILYKLPQRVLRRFVWVIFLSLLCCFLHLLEYDFQFCAERFNIIVGK